MFKKNLNFPSNLLYARVICIITRILVKSWKILL